MAYGRFLPLGRPWCSIGHITNTATMTTRPITWTPNIAYKVEGVLRNAIANIKVITGRINLCGARTRAVGEDEEQESQFV